MKTKIIPIKVEEEKEYIVPHTCPYAEDINGDYVSLCQCDEAQTRECAQDI